MYKEQDTMKNKHVVLGIALIAVLAIGAVLFSQSPKNNSSELIEKAVQTQLESLQTISTHVEAKANEHQKEDASQEVINQAILAIETNRMRIETQLRAYRESSVIVDNQKMTVKKLEAMQDEISALWESFSELSVSLIYMANESAYSEDYQHALDAFTRSHQNVKSKLEQLFESIK